MNCDMPCFNLLFSSKSHSEDVNKICILFIILCEREKACLSVQALLSYDLLKT